MCVCVCVCIYITTCSLTHCISIRSFIILGFRRFRKIGKANISFVQFTANSLERSLSLRCLQNPEPYQINSCRLANLKSHYIKFSFKQNARNATMRYCVPSEIGFPNCIPRLDILVDSYSGLEFAEKMKERFERKVLLDFRSGMECSVVLLAVLWECCTAKGAFNDYVKIMVPCYTLWDSLQAYNSNTISQGYSTATIYPSGNGPWVKFELPIL